MINTSAFIEELVKMINSVLPCYYDRASKQAVLPYCVVSGVNASDLAAGDLIMFDLDVWADDRGINAAVALERYCDELRNALQNAVIRKDGAFAGHIGFEGRDTTDDKETDLLHRRLYFSARIFYI